MAGELAPPLLTILASDLLYRGIHPMHFQQGLLLSGVFILNKKHTTEQGPSVGIEKSISLAAFHSLMREGWGVGGLLASVAHSQDLIVQPLPAPEWGEYSNAHAVITAYQKLTNKQCTDVARVLKNALQKNILINPVQRPVI
jgi:hypothetical protein